MSKKLERFYASSNKAKATNLKVETAKMTNSVVRIKTREKAFVVNTIKLALDPAELARKIEEVLNARDPALPTVEVDRIEEITAPITIRITPYLTISEILAIKDY